MNYPQLSFKQQWEIKDATRQELGECIALINVLKIAPLTPDTRKKLHYVTFKKGALSTTAIEGNTVSDKEYDDIILRQKDLPQSRKYQQTEINNMVDSFNNIINDVVYNRKHSFITPELIKELHICAVKNLGDDIQAIPGHFRQNNVHVGGYRAPDSKDVVQLINKYCEWLKSFGFERGQSIEGAITEAIVAHIYFEWIHPFGDGNGRTGRLIEYYILMRAGFPIIAGHILSNFYNNTRTRYYHFLNTCCKNRDLTDFIAYAIEGLRDGLTETYGEVQKSQVDVLWKSVIYEKFDKIQHRNRVAHKRKRTLVLNFPLNKGIELLDIPAMTHVLEYGNMSSNTLYKDVKELEDEQLLYKDGKLFYANWETLCKDYFTRSANA